MASTLKVQQMLKIRMILEKAQQSGAAALDSDDAEGISAGLVDYLLYTTGTHPRNRGMLKLDDEQEIQEEPS
jgi:hypothetical protein